MLRTDGVHSCHRSTSAMMGQTTSGGAAISTEIWKSTMPFPSRCHALDECLDVFFDARRFQQIEVIGASLGDKRFRLVPFAQQPIVEIAQLKFADEIPEH